MAAKGKRTGKKNPAKKRGKKRSHKKNPQRAAAKNPRKGKKRGKKRSAKSTGTRTRRATASNPRKGKKRGKKRSHKKNPQRTAAKNPRKRSKKKNPGKKRHGGKRSHRRNPGFPIWAWAIVGGGVALVANAVVNAGSFAVTQRIEPKLETLVRNKAIVGVVVGLGGALLALCSPASRWPLVIGAGIAGGGLIAAAGAPLGFAIGKVIDAPLPAAAPLKGLGAVYDGGQQRFGAVYDQGGQQQLGAVYDGGQQRFGALFEEAEEYYPG
ncbi:MAG: hypothetical protein JWL95_3237 [Gemmatimonadetes bacterium]|nr:hypothetical protein [Gemmatimonadota bacterium]